MLASRMGECPSMLGLGEGRGGGKGEGRGEKVAGAARACPQSRSPGMLGLGEGRGGGKGEGARPGQRAQLGEAGSKTAVGSHCVRTRGDAPPPARDRGWEGGEGGKSVGTRPRRRARRAETRNKPEGLVKGLAGWPEPGPGRVEWWPGREHGAGLDGCRCTRATDAA